MYGVRKLVLGVVVSFGLCGLASAADDVTWTFEKRLKELEKRVDALEGKKPATPATATPAATTATATPAATTATPAATTTTTTTTATTTTLTRLTTVDGSVIEEMQDKPGFYRVITGPTRSTFNQPNTGARSIWLTTPRMTAGVCLGPNCPR